jgi:hypothetical protein
MGGVSRCRNRQCWVSGEGVPCLLRISESRSQGSCPALVCVCVPVCVCVCALVLCLWQFTIGELQSNRRVTHGMQACARSTHSWRATVPMRFCACVFVWGVRACAVPLWCASCTRACAEPAGQLTGHSVHAVRQSQGYPCRVTAAPHLLHGVDQGRDVLFFRRPARRTARGRAGAGSFRRTTRGTASGEPGKKTGVLFYSSQRAVDGCRLGGPREGPPALVRARCMEPGEVGMWVAGPRPRG